MFRLQRIAVVLMLLALGSFAWAHDQKKDDANNSQQNTAEQRLLKATDVLQEMTGAQASAGIPDTVLQGANCIAIVPNMIKGAFIVGGRHGAGVATCRTQNGWSAPAFFQLSGASIGAQIGGQSTDLIMMIMNNQGMQKLLSGKFKVGAGVSAAAGPVGRQAAASGGWKAAILTYSRSKGAFAGANLQGAEIQQDDSTTRQFYGKDYDFRQILTGQVQPPPQAQAFLNAVQHAQTVAAK